MIRFYAESERGATIILEPKIKAELPIRQFCIWRGFVTL